MEKEKQARKTIRRIEWVRKGPMRERGRERTTDEYRVREGSENIR